MAGTSPGCTFMFPSSPPIPNWPAGLPDRPPQEKPLGRHTIRNRKRRANKRRARDRKRDEELQVQHLTRSQQLPNTQQRRTQQGQPEQLSDVQEARRRQEPAHRERKLLSTPEIAARKRQTSVYAHESFPTPGLRTRHTTDQVPAFTPKDPILPPRQTVREEIQCLSNDAYFQRVLRVACWAEPQCARHRDPAFEQFKRIPAVRSMVSEIRRTHLVFLQTGRRGEPLFNDAEWAT